VWDKSWEREGIDPSKILANPAMMAVITYTYFTDRSRPTLPYYSADKDGDFITEVLSTNFSRQ